MEREGEREMREGGEDGRRAFCSSWCLLFFDGYRYPYLSRIVQMLFFFFFWKKRVSKQGMSFRVKRMQGK